MPIPFLDVIDLNGNEIRNVVAQVLGADPGSPVPGQFWYRSDTQEWRVRLATTTVSLGVGTSIEEVQDAVGAMFTGNTETGITATYDDSDGTIDLAVTDSPLLNGQNAAFYLARANHTGTQLAATVSDFDAQVRTSRLDQMAAPTAAVGLNGQKITGLADGTATTDAATLGQLTAALEGRKYKEPVRVVALTNLTLSGTQNVDGVDLDIGDRVLAVAQTTQANRGVWVVASGAWTRATDLDASAEKVGAAVLVLSGAAGAGDIYSQTTELSDLPADGEVWVKISEGNVVYTADGTTLTLTGTSFSVANGGIGATQLAAGVAGDGLTGGAGAALAVNPGTGLEISADVVRIAAAAAGNGLTGGGGSALAVGAGTGIIVAADTVAVDTAVVARKFATALAGGATSEVITHNLNTRDVTVVVRNNASPYEQVFVEDEATTVNTVTIRAAANLPTGYRVLVVG